MTSSPRFSPAGLPLLITLSIQSFSAMALMAVPVLIPVEAGPPRLTAAGMGVYLLCSYMGAVLGSLSAGLLIERLGAIRASQWALMLSALGLLLAAVWPGALMLAAVLIGLGYGPITPASSHVLIHTTPARQRNLVFSIKQTGVPLGVALCGFFVPPLASGTGWVGTLLVLALACALVAASAYPIQAEMDAQTASAATAAKPSLSLRSVLEQLLEPFAVIWRHKPLRSLAAVSFILSGIQVSFTAYLVSYLTTSLGLAALLAGSVLALSQLGGVVGRIAWGYVADRLLRPLTTLALLVTVTALASLTTASLGAWPVAPPGLLLAGLMFIFGATASGWNGVYLAEVARQAPAGLVGMATSGTLACTFLGVLLGAPLFGLVVSSRGGYAAAFGLEALLALGAALLLLRFRSRFAQRG